MISRPDSARVIRLLEQQRRVAMIDYDQACLQTLLDDDLCFTHIDGRTDGKASLLAGLGHGAKVLLDDVADETILMHGDTAVVNGQHNFTLRRKGETEQIAIRVRVTSVWRLRDGAWRQIVYHGTRIAE